MSESNDVTPAAKLPLLQTNRGIGMLLGAIFIGLMVYIILGTDSFRVLRDGFYLGTFPMIGAALCIILCGIMLVDRFRNRGVEELENLSPKGLAFVCGAVVAGFIFIQLIRYTGFGVAGVVYLTALLYVGGVRPPYHALFVACCMTAGVYLLFFVVGIPLQLVPEWAGGEGY